MSCCTIRIDIIDGLIYACYLLLLWRFFNVYREGLSLSLTVIYLTCFYKSYASVDVVDDLHYVWDVDARGYIDILLLMLIASDKDVFMLIASDKDVLLFISSVKIIFMFIVSGINVLMLLVILC